MDGLKTGTVCSDALEMVWNGPTVNSSLTEGRENVSDKPRSGHPPERGEDLESVTSIEDMIPVQSRRRSKFCESPLFPENVALHFAFAYPGVLRASQEEESTHFPARLAPQHHVLLRLVGCTQRLAFRRFLHWHSSVHQHRSALRDVLVLLSFSFGTCDDEVSVVETVLNSFANSAVRSHSFISVH
ncbi:hypothetical protein AVEN_23486-1 [Araneus ventricosus]|uniref:Uncharacterized protein n=1 Tax=Araneus ventricosus TaxID=182803 RepID=A0A4Y2N5P4_ARAVE|nr:hypothetical protein AVEN_23486-1 [Araneus ventricosus]